jgi:galactose mutarotase-like enzyme
MEVLPGRGGRISSLRLGGHELLDQGIGADRPAAEDFVEAGAWGWDELVPTVDAAVWDGVELPDHGEAWRLPWTVLETGTAHTTMRCEGRGLPWRLDRRIELGAAVRADYVMTNLGAGPLPAFWCGHALFRYERDMEVDIGVTITRPEAGRSRKVWLRRGEAGEARLAWRSGVAVELRWDVGVAPYCGVWISDGDLGGYRQIAIEPATGGGDRPNPAQPPPMLPPGGSIAWWLEVRASASGRLSRDDP